MKITCHPGIGDISWIYSKLHNQPEEISLTIAEDKKTKRALPLVSLLPRIKDAEYGRKEDYYPLSKCGNAYWHEYVKAGKEGKTLYLSANNHLETGARLEAFLPDLETSFHYPLTTTEEDARQAEEVLPHGVVVGIYTSSRGGAQSWRGWQEGEWLDFCQRVHRDIGCQFVLIGAGWDHDLTDSTARVLQAAGLPVVNLCGKMTLGSSVEVLKRLDYFVGFASGMGILGNVLAKPGAMLYPSHLADLMSAWPCPVSLGMDRHIGALWDRPINVYSRISRALRKAVSDG